MPELTYAKIFWHCNLWIWGLGFLQKTECPARLGVEVVSRTPGFQLIENLGSTKLLGEPWDFAGKAARILRDSGYNTD